MTEHSSTPGTSRRVAVVTGGSRGIGRETAERLAADGYAVVVNYAGNEAEADKTVAAITEAGGEAIAVCADVADETEVAALFDATESTYGGWTSSSTRPVSWRSRPWSTSTSTRWTACTAPTSAARSSSTSRRHDGCARAARSSTSPAP